MERDGNQLVKDYMQAHQTQQYTYLSRGVGGITLGVGKEEVEEEETTTESSIV